MPHRGADWGAKLIAAGYSVDAQRTVAVNNERPRSEAVGRYALLILRRLRHALADELPADDLAALDELLDTGPRSILRRDDLVVRSDRTVWAARP